MMMRILPGNLILKIVPGLQKKLDLGATRGSEWKMQYLELSISVEKPVWILSAEFVSKQIAHLV